MRCALMGGMNVATLDFSTEDLQIGAVHSLCGAVTVLRGKESTLLRDPQTGHGPGSQGQDCIWNHRGRIVVQRQGLLEPERVKCYNDRITAAREGQVSQR